MSQQIIHIKDLKPHQARVWLMENDTDGADHWADLAIGEELVECVAEDLREFGVQRQGSPYMVIPEDFGPWQSDYIAEYRGRKFQC